LKSQISIDFIPIEEDGMHLMVKGQINGVNASFIIDTGASRSVFDVNGVEMYLAQGRKPRRIDKISAGLGTVDMESAMVTFQQLQLGDLVIRNYRAVLLNMEHILGSYEKLGLPRIDGILGGDLLFKYKAVIDYGEGFLSLQYRKPAGLKVK